MPYKPAKPCARPGRREKIHERFCKRHLTETRRREDKARGSAAARGYDRPWRRLAEAFKRANPLCKRCLERGVTRSMDCVDHIVPHAGYDDPLRLDWNNLQSLRDPCHGHKTATEDGAFGRPRKGARTV